MEVFKIGFIGENGRNFFKKEDWFIGSDFKQDRHDICDPYYVLSNNSCHDWLVHVDCSQGDSKDTIIFGGNE